MVTATLGGRTVNTNTGTTGLANTERALLADAVTVAGRYGRRIRLHLTDPTGKARRFVVHPTDRCTRKTPAGRGAAAVMHDRR